MPAFPPSRAIAAFALLLGLVANLYAGTVDTLVLGNEASEREHRLVPTASDRIAGGLGEPARRLLPPKSPGWEGGKIEFSLKVDPASPNYFTARLWGGEANPNRLLLFVEGRQIGYRHLGDVEQLDFGGGEPATPGRFYYVTTPIPEQLTRGKKEVRAEIRSYGRIWSYGVSFDKYQRAMESPSRGIYRVYSHTDACFNPPAVEKQGRMPPAPPVRSAPGPEVMEQLKARVNREIETCLSATAPCSQQEAQFLAAAWRVEWTMAHRNEAVPRRVAAATDAYVKAWHADPKLAKSDPRQYNAGWFGASPLANAVRLLGPAIPSGFLDETIDPGDGRRRPRREAWADLFVASRDQLRANRPHYTNQTMIQDRSIYLLNRGLLAIAPSRALPEEEARRLLHEAVGIEPWRGNYSASGPDHRKGPDYRQITDKGLTKELGYVGNYGEVLDWVAHILEATREPGDPRPGDPLISAQLAKMEHARAVFRYPALDADGNRAMRLETVVGWRDSSFPGDVCYAERSAWEGSAIYSAAAALDGRSVGAARQMFADNQFFASVAGLLKNGGLRTTSALLRIPDDYAAVLAAPPADAPLPMSAGRPDFVFSDEENGVVAIKRGDEILYASLYWRARYAVNFLARVHHITPAFDRLAVARQRTEFTPHGADYVRPDWTNMAFGNGGHRYPDAARSAHAGEVLPIARVPDEGFRPGEENIHAGKGDFYELRYGDYLIAMNLTRDREFEVRVPVEAKGAEDLVTGQKDLAPGAAAKVPPRGTVVLYLTR